MADKVTSMKLTVDLACSKCCKKAKKALCKFPQIRDELYDEKNNTIIIKVFCCDPEKLMEKLCNKGEGSIKSIVIIEPPKQTPAQSSEKPKEPEKVPPPAQSSEKPKEPEKVPAPAQSSEKPKEPEKVPTPAPTPAQAPVSILVLAPAPVPQQVPMNLAYYYGQYYEAQQYGPVDYSCGGGPHPHCCHEATYQPSCSIM